MKILFITMDALETNSSANIRNIGLLNGLSKLGYQIDTLSLEQNSQSINYDNSLVLEKGILRNRYYFPPNFLYNKWRTQKKNPSKSTNKNSISRIKIIIKEFCNKISIYDLQKINVVNVKKAGIDVTDYKVIISSSDPKSAHLIVRELLKSIKRKICWIQYWGDPMYDDITIDKNIWKRFLLKYEESSLLKAADRVIYTSPFTLEKQKKLYPSQKEKMAYAVQACPDLKKVEREIHNHIIIGYFGNYSKDIRDIQPLCQIVNKMGMELIVCGYGDSKIDGKHIIYYNRLEYQKVKELEYLVDIIVCVCNKRGTQIPGKIYYNSGYQKPVIVVLDGEYKGEMRSFFESFQRYILCENTENEIKKAIEEAMEEIHLKKQYKIPKEMEASYVAKTVLGDMVIKGEKYD